jgi:hypothetical protein
MKALEAVYVTQDQYDMLSVLLEHMADSFQLYFYLCFIWLVM